VKFDPVDVRNSIAEQRRRLEVRYIRARDLLKSPEWPQIEADLVQRVKNVIRDAKSDPHDALVALGRAKELVRQLDDPSDAIAEYTSLGEQLRDIKVGEPVG
jgi:hypothetical protein